MNTVSILGITYIEYNIYINPKYTQTYTIVRTDKFES